MNELLTQPGLRGLTLAKSYRSSRGDVVQDFYCPAFQVATSYSRAVGYFTSTSLALYSRGIETFAQRGGRMRLIASPQLTEDDVIDIERGYDTRSVIERATERVLEAEMCPAVLDGLGLLGRLIAEGRLDIKLAFVNRDGLIGVYHEKLGVFRDDLGDVVAFTGSSNETLGGLVANFESIQVYPGWEKGDGARALNIELDFEALWANRTPMLSVEDFPAVARDRLIKLGQERTATLPPNDNALPSADLTTERTSRLEIPHWLKVRGYQREAVESWLGNQGRGILKMATGTGKTKTSLIAATELARVLQRREEPLVLLVVAPLKDLVDQWIAELKDFGVHPIAIYENSRKWIVEAEEQFAEVRFGHRRLMAMVATNNSFNGPKFQSILTRISQPFLVIADEVHNLGSSSYCNALPANATYRLALSATPERWLDDDGTAGLVDYFGPIVYELGLSEAIDMGSLCRYRYLPRLVELSDVETQLYVDLSAQIAYCIASGEKLEDSDATKLGFLLRKRSAVLGHAVGKLAALREDLAARRESWFQLIYCAEGDRPSPDGESPGPNQVRDVMIMAGKQLGLASHQYTSRTTRSERRDLLRRFSTGDDLRALVAMRCLDEGVDIPDARTGYLLASSSNPRQFIQRRGRLLRPAEGKDHAEILDYLAVPADGAPLNLEIERRLLARELERANEFAKLSQNYEDTLSLLRPLKDRYQLMHL